MPAAPSRSSRRRGSGRRRRRTRLAIPPVTQAAGAPSRRRGQAHGAACRLRLDLLNLWRTGRDREPCAYPGAPRGKNRSSVEGRKRVSRAGSDDARRFVMERGPSVTNALAAGDSNVYTRNRAPRRREDVRDGPVWNITWPMQGDSTRGAPAYFVTDADPGELLRRNTRRCFHGL